MELQYNYLNLISEVGQNSTTKATYTWSAEGTKLGVREPGLSGGGFEYLGSLIYKYVNGELQLESTSFSNGRIIASHGSSTTYTPNYFITDHLGSVRVMWDGSNTERSDYYPFGGRWTSAETQATTNRFLYNGKELQTTGGVNYLDYGARMYDSRIGRWHSIDPLAEKNYYKTPYHFCSNNPICKVDPNGRWDIRVHLYNNRAEYGNGIAIVLDRNGNEVMRFEVRAEGIGGRDRNVRGADTPLGVYDIPEGDTWRASIGANRKSYGPNDRLVMNPESGEIVQTGRDGIRMHGGRQETYNAETDTWGAVANPSLKKTEGCLRAYDTDMGLLKDATSTLQKNDSSEIPGRVTILDDLKKVTVPAKKDNLVEVKTIYETPVHFFDWLRNNFLIR